MKRKKESSTTLVKKEDVNQRWYLFDATGKTLGRFSCEIAKVLRGKHKPDFTPNIDTGDGVIVINAEKVEVSGAKEAQKIYRSYTGFIGGLKETTYQAMKEKKPEAIIEHAVKGMMPKSRLGKQQLRKLRIFKGEAHSFKAQKPVKVEV